MTKAEILKRLSGMIEVSRLKSDLSDYAVLVAARDIVEKSGDKEKNKVKNDLDSWKQQLVDIGLFNSVKSVDKAINSGLIKVKTEIEVVDDEDEDITDEEMEILEDSFLEMYDCIVDWCDCDLKRDIMLAARKIVNEFIEEQRNDRR